MRYLSKAACAAGVITAVALIASAADAQSYDAPAYYGSAGYGRHGGTSIPYDAGGPAYQPGQRGQDSSNDFQLQGR
jgi:hypothetical protein